MSGPNLSTYGTGGGASVGVGPVVFWPHTEDPNGPGSGGTSSGGNNDGGNQVLGIPVGVPDPGRGVNEIIFPSNDYFANYGKYCSISSAQMMLSNPNATTIPFNDVRMPLLPPGQAITLNALCPLPGSDLPPLYYADPAPEGSDSTEHTLPPSILPLSAIIDFKWLIQIKDFANKTDMTNVQFDKVALRNRDQSGNPTGPDYGTTDLLAQVGKEFLILAGSLYSPQLTILIPPAKSFHAVQISLSISVWWPTKTRTTFQVPMTVSIPGKKGPPVQKYVEPKQMYLQCVMDVLPTTLVPLPTPSDDLYSKFSSLCSVKSPQMTLYPPPSGSSLTTTSLSVLPIGREVSLVAILPPLDLDVPVKGLPLADGSKLSTPGGLPLGTAVELKWHIQSADFDKDGTPTFSDDSRPALSQSDLGGRFELLSGSLTGPQLSFLPWPEASVTAVTDKQGNFLGNAPSKKYRAYQIRLEVRLSSPSRQSMTFFLPGKDSSLRCTVDSWAQAFDIDSSSNGLPRLPTSPTDLKPGSTAPGEGLADPTIFFRDMFTTSVDTLAPDFGQASTLLLSATDKSKGTATQVKEISDQRPNTKFTAAIDIGATFANVAKSIVGALGLSPAKDKAASGVLTVVDVLSKLFSIPVALDIEGTNITKVLQPKAGGPLPSLDNVSGNPASAIPDATALPGMFGAVPVGGITTLVAAAAKDLRAVPDATSNQKRVLINTLPNGLGLSLLPIPILSPVYNPAYPPSPATQGLSIQLKVNISTPGSSAPITLDLDLGKIYLTIPRIPIPQICMFTRHPEYPINAGPDAPDTLLVMDPDTMATFPNLDFARIAIDRTSTILKKVLGIFSPEAIANVGGSNLYGAWVDLASTMETMATRITACLALKPYSVRLAPLAQLTNTNQYYRYVELDKTYIGTEVWYKQNFFDNNHVYAPEGISGIYWIGCPGSTYKLKIYWDTHDFPINKKYLAFPSCYPITSNSEFLPNRAPYSIYSATIISGGDPAPVEVHDWTGEDKTEKFYRYTGKVEFEDRLGLVEFSQGTVTQQLVGGHEQQQLVDGEK